MQHVSGEILQISLGTPAHPVDGLSILCRATNPLGELMLIYVSDLGVFGVQWFGLAGILNLVGMAVCYTRGD